MAAIMWQRVVLLALVYPCVAQARRDSGETTSSLSYLKLIMKSDSGQWEGSSLSHLIINQINLVQLQIRRAIITPIANYPS